VGDEGKEADELLARLINRQKRRPKEVDRSRLSELNNRKERRESTQDKTCRPSAEEIRGLWINERRTDEESYGGGKARKGNR